VRANPSTALVPAGRVPSVSHAGSVSRPAGDPFPLSKKDPHPALDPNFAAGDLITTGQILTALGSAKETVRAGCHERDPPAHTAIPPSLHSTTPISSVPQKAAAADPEFLRPCKQLGKFSLPWTFDVPSPGRGATSLTWQRFASVGRTNALRRLLWQSRRHQPTEKTRAWIVSKTSFPTAFRCFGLRDEFLGFTGRGLWLAYGGDGHEREKPTFILP